jgi:Cdc6-like AAA superfamily ATPase
MASRNTPWNDAFKKAASQIAELKTPVLVVADDIDRLQADDLMSLLVF